MKLKLLRCSKYMLLAQETDARKLTDGYDENGFWFVNFQHCLKICIYLLILFTQIEIFCYCRFAS